MNVLDTLRAEIAQKSDARTLSGAGQKRSMLQTQQETLAQAVAQVDLELASAQALLSQREAQLKELKDDMRTLYYRLNPPADQSWSRFLPRRW